MKLNFNFPHDWCRAPPSLTEKLDALSLQLTQLQEKIMATIDEINAKLDETLTEVSNQTTAIESLDVFVEGLFDQIKELLRGQVPQAIIDKIDQLANAVKSNTPKIQDAMTDNVEPTP